MSKLPSIPGPEAIAAFERAGFRLDRIKGSHHILKKAEHNHLLTVPVHAGKRLGAGLLKSLVRGAGLDVETFCRLLDGETLNDIEAAKKQAEEQAAAERATDAPQG